MMRVLAPLAGEDKGNDYLEILLKQRLKSLNWEFALLNFHGNKAMNEYEVQEKMTSMCNPLGKTIPKGH